MNCGNDRCEKGNRPIRLLHVVSRLDSFGGTPIKLSNAARAMRGSVQSSFFCVDGIGEIGLALKKDGFHVSAARTCRFGPRLVHQLIDEIRLLRPDFLVSHFYKPTICARIGAMITGCPLITYHHGNIRKTLPYRVLDQLTKGITKLHLANSRYTQSLIAERYGVSPNNVQVLYPYVPDLPKRGTAASGLVVGNVAGLNVYKGQDTLLRAFALVLEKRPDARLRIAGEGPLHANLEGLARELHVSERTAFLGYVSDIPELLSQFSMFVFPSVDEGFGMAVVEAMLAGVPVIVSRAGGLPEIVEDGVSGLVIPRSQPRALADAILKVAAAPEMALQMARNARTHAIERFASEALTAELAFWQAARKAFHQET